MAMKLCRFDYHGRTRCGFYDTQRVLPLDDLAAHAGQKYLTDAMRGGELERLLPTDSALWSALVDLHEESMRQPGDSRLLWLDRSEVQLLPPIAHPRKLLLLAGNYAEHVAEQGGVVTQREQTFPYVFTKPASTTLVGDQARVAIPPISPDKIDHEVELAVVIGKTARRVSAQESLKYVAGYTIINDLSDRGFRPNPGRQQRPRDAHFDWLHGKWHDGFCPCGPCLVSADEVSDPQTLKLDLWVDGDLRQSGSTDQQIFSVAQVIEFLSSWMTLEPGDIISTGTPSGVGNATGRFLPSGQTVVAQIEPIGKLTTILI
jgi:2-keto-4-pentenoate hydratase/2-oxohepta-3-ene-1,7-dioic acid hydratase in catechol pathway